MRLGLWKVLAEWTDNGSLFNSRIYAEEFSGLSGSFS